MRTHYSTSNLLDQIFCGGTLFGFAIFVIATSAVAVYDDIFTTAASPQFQAAAAAIHETQENAPATADEETAGTACASCVAVAVAR